MATGVERDAQAPDDLAGIVQLRLQPAIPAVCRPVRSAESVSNGLVRLSLGAQWCDCECFLG